MALGLLTLITALSISAVAIYYSVAGLVAIFAAAAIPIMIMGGVLEVGKLVTAVWLHKHWKQATWWLKTYLSTAVLVLMLITSMGIFGFLSKARIEQTSATDESVAQIERLDGEIARQLSIVGRAENKIRELEGKTFNNDTQIQEQIDKEQERIDNAYDRIQPAIDEQNQIIQDQTNLYTSQIETLDRDFEQIQAWINEGTEDAIKRVQGMVGATPDGDWGRRTSNAVDDWREENRAKHAELIQKIEDIATDNLAIQNARQEISRLRQVAEDQIAESNRLINRLRERLGTGVEDVDVLIDEQFERVRAANDEIEILTDQKFEIEAEYRKLEAEVGPIKYIAEFVYGEDADRNLLEEAVRWVIITIIFVFDPLAVLLLIASQYTFEWRKTNKKDDSWKEYERARAEKIIANPGFEPNKKEEVDDIQPTEDTHSESGTDGQDSRDTDDTNLQEDNLADDESTVDTVDEEPVPTGETVEEDAGSASDNTEDVKEYPDTRNAFFYAGEIEQSKKKDLRLKAEIETPEEKQRREYVDALESDATISERKRQWKLDNPNENLKSWKTLYIQGRIDKLPWIPEDEYIQNGEQSENTIWNRLKKD